MYVARTAGKARTTGGFILSSHSNLGVAKGGAFSSDCTLLSSDSKKCERLERITKVRLWESLDYNVQLTHERLQSDNQELQRFE